MKHSTGAASRGDVTGVISLCLKVVSISVPCHWLEKEAKPRSEFFRNKVTCGLWQNDLCHKQNSMGIFKRKWKWTFSALKDVLSQLKANMCQDHTVNLEQQRKDQRPLFTSTDRFWKLPRGVGNISDYGNQFSRNILAAWILKLRLQNGKPSFCHRKNIT